MLYKRFLTPFRDGIWNRRQVSVGDRGVLPTRPRNRRGYALLAHTLGKMRSCATGERSNTVIRTVMLKKYNYTSEIIFGRKFIPHSQSPRNVSVRTYIPHSRCKTFPFTGTSHTIFPVKSFVIALPLHTILTILSFALLNASHTVRRRNCVAKAVHHTQFLCGKRLRKVA